MPKLTEARKRIISKTSDRIDLAFAELCDCQHELEGCGCKAQVKKLDTITGKIYNLLHELCEITRGC